MTFRWRMGFVLLLILWAGSSPLSAQEITASQQLEDPFPITCTTAPLGSAIVWMVLRQIAGVVAVGTVGGAVGVLVVGRLVKPLLFGVAPTDPWTIGSAFVLLVGIAVLAGGLPARAASRLDPATVLRE